ncbi:MAG: ribosome assembly RNA-binding protein YhbY [Bacillales bacterium]|jgi:RNA-binding protein|nr:ribosome assembly RNA-binding protein YhbY [Bacillales bacterium]
MILSKKQIAFLRGKANTLKPIFQVGKDGVSENFIEGIDLALTSHELIKIAVLKTAPEELRTLSLDIIAPLKAYIVQIIGRTIVLYRPSKKRIIELP